MIEQLPCASCTALCCGPVSITTSRLKLVREHLRNMPHVERERLAKQKRSDMDCRFIDKENHHCTIYPVRPWLCQVFGRTEGLVCPKVGHLVQIMPTFLVEQGFTQEGMLDYEAIEGVVMLHANEQPAGISTHWDWRTLDFK